LEACNRALSRPKVSEQFGRGVARPLETVLDAKALIEAIE
jgi:hypothetical protein